MAAKVFQDLGLGLAVHLHAYDRLGNRVFVGGVKRQGVYELSLGVTTYLYHGVDHEVDAVALAVDLHPRRVNEEGHIVVDHLHHSVARLPAVLLEPRVIHADLGRTGHTLAGDIPVGHGRPVNVHGRAPVQVLRGNPAVILAHELLDLWRLILW